MHSPFCSVVPGTHDKHVDVDIVQVAQSSMHSSHTFSSPAVPSGHSFMHSFVPVFLSLCMKKPSAHDVQSVGDFEHSEHGDEHSMHECSTVAYPFGHSERH